MAGRFLVVCLVVFAGCAGRQSMSVGEKKTQQSGYIQYSGNSGDSHEDAVAITGVQKQSEGMQAEYDYISKKHGQKGKDWQVAGQTIIREKDKVFDVIEVRLIASGDGRIYYFDVSKFPWKKR